ncbi:MAG TPA: cell division protein FtsQ/DivIB [bacterium]|uniref:Cell division protein FtsQ n=1 Tax=candidate division TA06 bacterium ADurb.Bin417 TaxID=1852828 RepID=A0A1V5MGL5_UNCT6|nr:MAG: Cell division protein FtsQ [candidate division TA06 bacterium ADurb.Bin417]HNS47959.1 cell division protein FtsQ/DivIB [bacterium]
MTGMKSNKRMRPVLRKELERRRRRRLKLLAWAAGFILLAGFIGLGLVYHDCFFRLPFFRVQRVIVEPAGLEFPELAGRSLFFINPAAIAAEAAADPAIGQVRVRRLFPDTVKVTMVRRQPFARALLNEGGEAVVDRTGAVINGRAGEAPPKLEIAGLGRRELSERLPEIAVFYDLYRPEVAFQRITFQPDGFRLTLASGQEIRLPREGLEACRKVLRRILADFEQKDIKYGYIDLRFADPVFTFQPR